MKATTYYATTVRALRAQYGSAAAACNVTNDATRALAKALQLDDVVAEAMQLNADDRWTCNIEADVLRGRLVELLESALGFVPELPVINF